MFIRAALIAATLALPAYAEEPWAPEPAGDHVLSEFHWVNRILVVLVVFADSPSDPRFIEQMERISEDPVALISRDVIVLADTDPAAKSALREALRPRGFAFVLIGKDGAKYPAAPARAQGYAGTVGHRIIRTP